MTSPTDDTVEFRRRLAHAMNTLEDAARAIHDARLMSPNGEDIHLLRKAAAAVSEQIEVLHLIATHDNWTTAA